MNRIAAIALLYAVASMPAVAADDSAYMPAETDATPQAALKKLKAEIERMSTFSLLEKNGSFSLSGKLSIPRLSSADEFATRRDAPTYGLRSQLVDTPTMGVKFGWDRYIAGKNSGDNLYSLTAVVRF